MRGVLRDFRDATRALARSPGVTLCIIAILALGVGSATAAYSLYDVLLRRGLPGADSERLAGVVTVKKPGGDSLDASYPDYLDYRGVSSFSAMLAYYRFALTLQAREPERLWGEAVSPNYFSTLGVRLAAGRGFEIGEQSDAANPTAILSFACARRLFGSASAALGQAVRLNGAPFEIVGIAPKDFPGIAVDRGEAPQVWIPLQSMGDVIPPWRAVFAQRSARWLRVVARVKPELTRSQAEAALAGRASELARTFPDSNRDVSVRLLPGHESRFNPSSRGPVISFVALLMGVVGFMLLSSSVNAATLLVLRGMDKEQQIAIRFALGATPTHVARQLLAEGVLLALAGCIASLPVAIALMALLPRSLVLFQVPVMTPLTLNGAALAVGVLVSLVTMAIATLPPLRGAMQVNCRERLGVGRSMKGSSSKVGRVVDVLLTTQVAVCFLLVVLAQLLVATVGNASRVPLGYQSDQVLIASVDLTGVPSRRSEAAALALYRGALKEVNRLPGITSASWAAVVPLAPRKLVAWFRQAPATGADQWIETACNIVGPDYMRTLGIPVISGREFNASDSEQAPGVAMVNQAFVRRHWPDEDPIGKMIRVRGREREDFEVVGVVGDVRYASVFESPVPYLYLPLYQRHLPEMTLHVKAQAGTLATSQGLTSTMRSFDGGVALFDRKMLEERLAAALSRQRAGAACAGVAGLFAIVVASVGIYGAASYSIERRRTEMAVRVALGASRWRLMELLLRRVAWYVLVGTGIGAGVSVMAARILDGILFSVQATDVTLQAASALLVAVVAFGTSYLAARAALKISPREALD